MKPIVTWVVLANAKHAHVVSNHGPGKGLNSVPGMQFQAAPPVEYSDRAGVGHSIAGPGVAAVDQGDPKELAEANFARDICSRLDSAFEEGSYDRLVLVAGPHMLGQLRKSLGKRADDIVLAERPKDLTAMPIPELNAHLSDMLQL